MTLDVAEGIRLTEFRAEDKAACIRYLNDREIFDRTLRVPSPYTEADFDTWMSIVRRATEEHGEPAHFAIRHDAKGLIGALGFDALVKGHSAEIGYWLARPYWGQGIMTAAVRRACEHARGRWQLVRITAHVFAFNVASAKVAEKCGFVHEGTLRKARRKNGKFIDVKLYALVW